MTRLTSERHTDILNGYKAGQSRFNEWTAERLGHLILLDWEWGALKMRWEIDDRFLMPDGVMFGGHTSSVADHVTSLATMTVLEANEDRFRTSRLETNFLRPLMAPHAIIEANVMNVSASLIHVEADIYNSDEKLAAKINAVEVRTTTAAKN